MKLSYYFEELIASIRSHLTLMHGTTSCEQQTLVTGIPAPSPQSQFSDSSVHNILEITILFKLCIDFQFSAST
jgi:hypothetical protein